MSANKQQLVATLMSSYILRGDTNEEKALEKAYNMADKIIEKGKQPKPKEKRVVVKDVQDSIIQAMEALKEDYGWYNAGIRPSDKTYNADRIKRAQAYIELKKAIENK